MSGYSKILFGALRSTTNLTPGNIPSVDANSDLQDTTDFTATSSAIVIGPSKHLEVQAYTDSSLTGSLALLTAIAGNIRLTNASLVSVRGITPNADGAILILMNRTGNTVTILDSSLAVGVAANRVITGTGSNLSFLNDTAVHLQYDIVTARWQVIGGSGSGGVTDHTLLTNIGTNTHAQIDTALSRLANTSGTNTGDQDLSVLVPKTYTVNGHALSGNITVTKTDVGLSNVDNTSDIGKPVSTAQQSALDLRLNLTGGTLSGALAMGSNKITGVSNGTTTNDAVNYGQLSSLVGGLNYDVNGPVLVPNMVSDVQTTPPGSPVNGASYLAASGASGGWTAGHVYEYNSASLSWTDVLGRAIIIGDRFGINFESGMPTAAGGFSSKAGNITTVTNATPGSYTYTFTTPSTNLAVYINGNAAQDLSHLYYYNSVWIDLLGSATVRPKDGNALSYTGNILNVGFDNVTIDLTSNQLEVKALGISNSHINATAAIDASKISTGVVSNAEFNYLDGVTSAIQTQLNGKQATLSAIYSQLLTVVASGASGSNQINGPVSPLISISLPASGTWIGDELEVYLNGLQQYVTVDYNFVSSTQINFVDTLQVTDVVKFFKTR